MDCTTNDVVTAAAGADIAIVKIACALIAAAIAIWIVGCPFSKRFDWPLRIHRTYRRLRWVLAGAWMIAAFVIGISILIAILLMKLYGFGDEHSSGLLASPGIVAALAGGVATVMTFLTTQIVRARQEAQIPSIGWLLDEASAVILQRLQQVVGKDRDSDIPVDFYMLDYSPAIGSRPSPQQHERFKKRLIDAAKSRMFDLFLLFSSDEFLDSFYEVMGDKADSSTANELIGELAKERPVWRSSDIGQMHLIIVGDVAFQYVVLPAGITSKAVGLKTEDKFQVAFLKETVMHSLRSAITPKISVDLAGKCTLAFKTQQPGTVTQLKIELCKDDKFLLDAVTVLAKELAANSTTVTIEAAELRDARYLKLTATRQSGSIAQPLSSLGRQMIPEPQAAT